MAEELCIWCGDTYPTESKYNGYYCPDCRPRSDEK